MGGTLHRCLLATLKQDGFQDQRSQRNITLVRVTPQAIGQIDVPFIVGNPGVFTETLVIAATETFFVSLRLT